MKPYLEIETDEENDTTTFILNVRESTLTVEVVGPSTGPSSTRASVRYYVNDVRVNRSDFRILCELLGIAPPL